jgi:hypothetical protein
MNPRLIERMALPAGAFGFTMALFAPFSLLGIDAHHDGLMFKPALDVASGQTLFKDTFSQYGFLTTQIQVGFLLVFGKRLAVIKLATVLMYGISAAFLVSAWRTFLSLPLTLFAYVLWLLTAYFYSQELIFHAWSSVYCLAFQAAALFFLIQSVRTARPALWAGLCGAATALAYWCRFPVGTLLTGSIAAAYVALSLAQGELCWKSRRLWVFLAIGLVIHVVFLSIIALEDSWSQWIYQNYVYPYTNVVTTGRKGPLWNRLAGLVARYPFLLAVPIGGALAVFLLVLKLLPAGAAPIPARRPSLLGCLLVFLACGCLATVFWKVFTFPRFWGLMFFAVVLCATAAIALRWLWGGRDLGSSGGPEMIGFLSGLVALGSYLQYYPVYDARHIFWAAAPGMGVFVFYVCRMARGQRLLVAIALGTLLAPLAVTKFQLARAKLCTPYVQLADCPILRNMKIPAEEAEKWIGTWHAIQGYTRQHPNTAIVVYGIRALYATLVPNLTNAHPFYIYFMQHPAPPGLFERRDAFIREFKPLVVAENDGIRPYREEMSYQYQRANVIDKFGYRELFTIAKLGDVFLQPGP